MMYRILFGCQGLKKPYPVIFCITCFRVFALQYDLFAYFALSLTYLHILPYI